MNILHVKSIKITHALCIRRSFLAISAALSLLCYHCYPCYPLRLLEV